MPEVARGAELLVEEGDLSLAQGMVHRTYRTHNIGLCLGYILLREKPTSPPMRHSIYLAGTFQLQGVTILVGVIPGRCDLFLGHWWTHPQGPLLLRLADLRLDDKAPFPLDLGVPGKWRTLSEDQQKILSDITEGVQAELTPENVILGPAERQQVVSRYRQCIAYLVGQFRTWAAGRGYILSDTDIAHACHPDWTDRDLLKAQPSLAHALAVVLATQRAIALTAATESPAEWEVSLAVVSTGFAQDHGLPLSADGAASVIATGARTLQGLPAYATNGALTDWAQLRRSDPRAGILPALWHLNDSRIKSDLDRSQTTVLRGPPRKDGLIRRGGTVDDRKRWEQATARQG